MALGIAGLVGAAQAETVGGALIKAYLNNPEINQQRASVRVADENVPKANAGYLPNIAATANAGLSHVNGNGFAATNTGFTEYGYAQGAYPRGYGVQLNQNVFDGNKTLNSIRNAESGVLGAREQLRNTEQNTLLSGVTAYMDVLRDTAILDLDRNNVDVLKEQLRETRDRFNVGEVTRTDVAQAEASLSSSQATEISAVSTLQSSIARYRQVIGDQPTSLAPVKPISRPLPRSLQQAVDISQVEHPAIVASLHGVDSALLQIKIAESSLYPQIGLTGSLQQAFDVSNTPGQRAFVATVMGQITIPIFQGGAEYASTRQAKESLTQTEMQSEFGPQPGSGGGRRRVGRISGFGGRGARRPRRSVRQRSCVAGRARGGQGRATHDPRCLERPAGASQRSGPVGVGRARRCRELIFLAVGGRTPQCADARPCGRGIRPAHSLQSGSQQMVRFENAGREVAYKSAAAVVSSACDSLALSPGRTANQQAGKARANSAF